MSPGYRLAGLRTRDASLVEARMRRFGSLPIIGIGLGWSKLIYRKVTASLYRKKFGELYFFQRVEWSVEGTDWD
jgi:hypothetical protein